MTRMSDFDPRDWTSPPASRARPPSWCAATTARSCSVERKAGDEPVTDADHAANALIVARLARGVPRRRRAVRGDPRHGRAPRAAARLDGRSDRRHPRLHPGRLRLRRHDRPGDRRPARASARSATAVRPGLRGRGRRRRVARGASRANAIAAAHVDADAARPTSGWSPPSRTARRASTPSSRRCRSPTR